MRIALLNCSAALAALLATPAHAQRTDDDAVGNAEDAFGLSIGGEQIGIYGPDNVRGFSPVAAGNVRIEGLYFDQQAFVTDRLIEGRSVHVGISAQGYPFPAPTGIADYRLRRPGARRLASVAFTLGPYGGRNAEVDAQLPIVGTRLGLTAGAGLHHGVTEAGGRNNTESYGASLRFQPSDTFFVQPFYGRIEAGDEERGPLIFVNGDFLPPAIERPRYFGQDWAVFNGTMQSAGLVSRARLAGIDLALGLFRSSLDVDSNFSDLLFDTGPDGHVGRRIVVAEADNRFASSSGELRASRAFTEGPRRHLLHASLRGRALNRRYGGSAIVDLGESRVGVEDPRAEPVLRFGGKSRDEVRQRTVGAGYELRWRNVGEVSLGLQRTDYSKGVTTPSGPLPETRDSPLLFSATGAAYLTRSLALFGGLTRGLEESEVAPANAVNRNEAPPAIETRQKDVGVRYGLRQGLSLIVGLFDIEKPYFNLDSGSRFRQLGSVRNRGAEFSLAGRLAKGLSVVAGATLLDAKISGERVESGAIGERPVGYFALRTLANVNWQVPWHDPLTLTARFESTSDRTANAGNTLEIPARSVTSLGARYRLALGGTPLLVRANVDNIFDTFGWNVAGSGFFIPNGPRRYSLSVAADI